MTYNQSAFFEPLDSKPHVLIQDEEGGWVRRPPEGLFQRRS